MLLPTDPSPSETFKHAVFLKALDFHREPNPHNQLVILADLVKLFRDAGYPDWYELNNQ